MPVSEQDANPFEQFKEDVKKALKMLDCWGSESEVRMFLEALQKYRTATGLQPEMCAHERPPRKVMCQLSKGHKESHQAVIFWEDE